MIGSRLAVTVEIVWADGRVVPGAFPAPMELRRPRRALADPTLR